jgi:hypothetical protein
MRRNRFLASLVASVVLLLALVLAGVRPQALAQPATPTAAPTPAVEVLAQSSLARSTAETVTLVRVELAPGASTPVILEADGNRVLYVEEGTIRFRVESGKVSLSDPSGPSKGKPIKVNTWIDVKAGQSLIVSKNARYEYRNDGDVVAVILASGGSDVVAEGCGGGCS